MRSKIRSVAFFEYRRLVFTRQFLVALLLVPFLIGASAGLGYFFESVKKNTDPLGYVDLSGLLTESLPKRIHDRHDNPVEMIRFADRKAAAAALKKEDIQAYYLIPADYINSREIKVVYGKKRPEDTDGQVADLVRVNILKDRDPRIALLATIGSERSVRLLESNREFGSSPTFGQIFPLISGIVLMVLIAISSTYLAGIITLERENRVLEILVTSISPKQLITGKLLGVLGATLTQFTFWAALGLAGIGAGRALGYQWFMDLSVDPPVLILMICLLVPAYLMIAGIVAGIGAVISSSEISQQLGMGFMGVVSVSVWPISLVLQNPNGSLAVTLSLFPLTAPMILPIRTIVSAVPEWQIASGIGILITAAAVSVWFAGQALRLNLLFSGRRLI